MGSLCYMRSKAYDKRRIRSKGWNTDENGFLCAIAFNITHWKPIEKLED